MKISVTWMANEYFAFPRIDGVEYSVNLKRTTGEPAAGNNFWQFEVSRWRVPLVRYERELLTTGFIAVFEARRAQAAVLRAVKAAHAKLLQARAAAQAEQARALALNDVNHAAAQMAFE